MKSPSTLIVLLAITLTGCFYEPSENFFADVPQPDLSMINIEVENEGDTIYVFRPTTVIFDVLNGTSVLELVEVELLVGGSLAQNVRISGNKVTWNTFPINSGTVFLPIELNLVARSTSNSLASQLGAEFITIEKSYTWHSDSDPPAPVALNSAQIENGIMTLRWSPPTQVNFERYLLEVTYFNQDGTTNGQTRRKLFNKTDELLYEDRTFAGGQVKYRVDLLLYNGLQAGEERLVNLDPLELSYELDPDENIIMNWTEIPIYGHNLRAEINFNNRVTQEVTDLTSTSYSSNFVVDGLSNSDIIFTLESNDPDYPLMYSDTVSINNAFTSFPSEGLFDIGFSVAANSLYFGYSDDGLSIDRYGISPFDKTGQLIDIGPDMTISRNGQYAYAYQQNLRQIVRFDPVSMSEISRFNLEDVVGFRTQDGEMTVTDNHKAVIRVLGDDRLDRFYIIDLNTLTIELSDLSCMIKISPDGLYALQAREVKKFETGVWSTVATINQSENICSQQNFAIFEKDGSYSLWRTFSMTAPFNEVSVYSWNNSTPQGSTLEASTFIPEGNITFNNEDPISGYAGFSSVDYYFIYDPFSLELKYSTRRSDIGSIFLFNSTLYSTIGFITQIEID